MSGQLARFPRASNVDELELRDRLVKLAAILAAIDAGELLAALPECALAQKNHETALNLLSIIEIEVNALCSELGEPSSPELEVENCGRDQLTAERPPR